MSMQTTGGTDARSWALIVWILYLVGWLSGHLTSVIGLIIAYVKRGDLAGTPYASHMTYAIRTFWIALVGGLIGVLLLIVLIGWLVLGAVGLWSLYRMIRGVVFALDGKPIPDPQTYL